MMVATCDESIAHTKDDFFYFSLVVTDESMRAHPPHVQR